MKLFCVETNRLPASTLPRQILARSLVWLFPVETFHPLRGKIMTLGGQQGTVPPSDHQTSCSFSDLDLPKPRLPQPPYPQSLRRAQTLGYYRLLHGCHWLSQWLWQRGSQGGLGAGAWIIRFLVWQIGNNYWSRVLHRVLCKLYNVLYTPLYSVGSSPVSPWGLTVYPGLLLGLWQILHSAVHTTTTMWCELCVVHYEMYTVNC